MRKARFYARLAATGLWRNRRVYLPYLLAGAITVATFYILLAIGHSESLQTMPGASTIESMMYVGTYLLAILSAIILFWTNGFLVKRRRQELGLYTVLGLQKSSIAAMMLFETLLVALLAIGSGLVGGMLLARLLFLAIQRIVRFEVALTLPISPRDLLGTAVFFAAIYFIAFLGNLWRASRLNPVEIMAEAKQGQKEPKASLLVTLLGVAFLVAGYLLAVQDLTPADAINIFLLAAILVIIGTYLLFLSGSIFLLKLLRKNKRYYYSPRHFVNVSGMLYRMRQNAAGLASICILSCMVMVTVSATVALYAAQDESIQNQHPYSVQIGLYSQFEVAEHIEMPVRALAAETGVEIPLYHMYTRRANHGVYQTGDSSFKSWGEGASGTWRQVYYYLLEDYNALTGRSIQLGEGEILLHTAGEVYGHDTLTLDDITYRVFPAEDFYGKPNGVPDNNIQYTFFLRDEAAMQGLLAAWLGTDGWDEETRGPVGNPAVRIAFNIEGNAQERAEFTRQMEEWWLAEMGGIYDYQMTQQETHGYHWIARNGSFFFLGAYFGVLFLLAAVLIIYYKQVTEGYEDRTRYDILQQVGMGRGEVRRTIRHQVSVAFFLPLGVALVHICVAFLPLSRGLVNFGIMSPGYLLAALGITALVYAAVYGLVYLRTARTYYKIVERKPS